MTKEWIQTSERKPEVNGRGAFYDFSKKVLVFRNGKIEMGFYDGGTGRWRVNGQTVGSVSHWMPLPDKPETT